jgi:hypothetical protein
VTKHQQNYRKRWKFWELIHKDHCRTTHEVAYITGISHGVCQEILTENLNMQHIATKFVPRILTNDKKQWCVNMCLQLCKKANKDPAFISSTITDDRSWIYSYDPETKQQLPQRKSPLSPKAKKAQQLQSLTKRIPIVFFNVKTTVHREFVPPNIMVNSNLYCDVLRSLRENV